MTQGDYSRKLESISLLDINSTSKRLAIAEAANITTYIGYKLFV
jgi:hypothetical protein